MASVGFFAAVFRRILRRGRTVIAEGCSPAVVVTEAPWLANCIFSAASALMIPVIVTNVLKVGYVEDDVVVFPWIGSMTIKIQRILLVVLGEEIPHIGSCVGYTLGWCAE